MEVVRRYHQEGSLQINEVLWKKGEASTKQGTTFVGRPVLDIRNWNGDEPLNGICLPDDALVALLIDAASAKPEKQEEAPKKCITFGNDTVYLYEVYATLLTLPDGRRLLHTLSSMGNRDNPKHDFRFWSSDMNCFSSGISLQEEEYLAIAVCLAGIADEKQLYIPAVPPLRKESADDLISELVMLYGRLDTLANRQKFMSLVQKVETILKG